MPERSSPLPNPNSPPLVYVLLLSPELPSDISSVKPHCMTYSSGIRTLFIPFWLMLDEFYLGNGKVSAARRLLTPFDFMQEVCWVSFVSMFDWFLPWQARAALKNCLQHKRYKCECAALLFSLFARYHIGTCHTVCTYSSSEQTWFRVILVTKTMEKISS